MRMFDLLTSGVIFAGRRGWGVVAALGIAFVVILALGGSWARWVYLQDARSQGCEDDAAVCESNPKEAV